jgi:hypothetical protein
VVLTTLVSSRPLASLQNRPSAASLWTATPPASLSVQLTVGVSMTQAPADKRGKRFSAAGLQAAAPVVTPAEADAFGVSSPTAMRLAQLASSPAERKDSRFIGGRSSPGALLRHGGGPANHTVHPRFPPRWSQTYQRYPGQPNRSPGVSPDRTLQHEVATFLQERGDLLGDELRPLVDDQRPVEILGVVDPVLDLVKVISK